MFNYDFTLDEGGVERSEDANQQEISNKLAKEAVKACASLGGYLHGENVPPLNNLTRSILNALLTPYLADQLGTDKPEQVLKTLNSNSETPYLVWDNGTRAELIDFLETQRSGRDEVDPTVGASFTYSSHSGELRIGGIFIKIYNQQPTFPIHVSTICFDIISETFLKFVL